jgi:hypothetical protein
VSIHQARAPVRPVSFRNLVGGSKVAVAVFTSTNIFEERKGDAAKSEQQQRKKGVRYNQSRFPQFHLRTPVSVKRLKGFPNPLKTLPKSNVQC